MVKKNYFVQFVISLALIVVLVCVVMVQSAGGTGLIINENSYDNKTGGRAEVFSVLDYWTEKLSDQNVYVFNMHIYNFGNVEAKNVEIVCEIYYSDAEGNILNEVPITSVRKNIGNIASTSFRGATLEANKNSAKEGDSPAAICKIDSCENCEIILNRIPD